MIQSKSDCECLINREAQGGESRLSDLLNLSTGLSEIPLDRAARSVSKTIASNTMLARQGNVVRPPIYRRTRLSWQHVALSVDWLYVSFQEELSHDQYDI